MVRNHPHVPVMVVTARTDEIDVVAGLTRGAVDYVAKPFRLAELLARVRSHLRMARAAAAEGDRPGGRDTLVIGDLTIDRAARRVHVGDEELGLRPKEFDVLDLLARHAGTVVTREQLSTTCGTRTGGARRRPSTCTSTASGASSESSRVTPAASPRSAASATASTACSPTPATRHEEAHPGDDRRRRHAGGARAASCRPPPASATTSSAASCCRCNARRRSSPAGCRRSERSTSPSCPRDSVHDLALYDHTGVLVDGNGPPTADPIVAEALTGVVNEGIVEGDLVAALPIRVGDDGPEFVVRVTESAAESHHRVRRDLGMLALAAIAIIAAAALAGILLARRLSRPIEDLRDWTGSLGEAEGVPPPHSGIDELDTLGSAFGERRRAHPRAARARAGVLVARRPPAAHTGGGDAHRRRGRARSPPRRPSRGADREPRGARPPRVDDRQHAGARPLRPPRADRVRGVVASSPTTAPAGNRATPRSGARSATAARRCGHASTSR